MCKTDLLFLDICLPALFSLVERFFVEETVQSIFNAFAAEDSIVVTSLDNNNTILCPVFALLSCIFVDPACVAHRCLESSSACLVQVFDPQVQDEPRWEGSKDMVHHVRPASVRPGLMAQNFQSMPDVALSLPPSPRSARNCPFVVKTFCSVPHTTVLACQHHDCFTPSKLFSESHFVSHKPSSETEFTDLALPAAPSLIYHPQNQHQNQPRQRQQPQDGSDSSSTTHPLRNGPAAHGQTRIPRPQCLRHDQ